jgi:hypothetical protein
VHQLPVPKKAKQKHETEGCNECEEEFFPVHKVFLSAFSLRPGSPESLIAKPSGDVDLNLSRLTAYENDEARMSNVERSPNAQMTKRRNAGSSFGVRHYTFVIRH